MTQPTQQEVKELFNYSDDGFLVWSVNRKRARVGNKVGAHDPSGYLRTRVNEKLHLVHRLIYLWHHGYMPEMVDHIDGNKSNNRIENLREANRVTNQYNSKLSRMNTSGSKNVSFCAQTKKWAVKMMLFGKRRTLGRFDDIELADLVAREARAKFHGAFARNY
jgi:hypothetical protein